MTEYLVIYIYALLLFKYILRIIIKNDSCWRSWQLLYLSIYFLLRLIMNEYNRFHTPPKVNVSNYDNIYDIGGIGLVPNRIITDNNNNYNYNNNNNNNDNNNNDNNNPVISSPGYSKMNFRKPENYHQSKSYDYTNSMDTSNQLVNNNFNNSKAKNKMQSKVKFDIPYSKRNKLDDNLNKNVLNEDENLNDYFFKAVKDNNYEQNLKDELELESKDSTQMRSILLSMNSLNKRIEIIESENTKLRFESEKNQGIYQRFTHIALERIEKMEKEKSELQLKLRLSEKQREVESEEYLKRFSVSTTNLRL